MKTLVLLVASVALLVSLLTLTRKKEDEQHHLQTRWTHDNSHLRDMTQDHIHPWMNNAWYRYVHDRTKGEPNNTACYVCSHMPSTSTHPTFYVDYMNKTQAKCAASFAGIGYQHKKIIINETSSTIHSLNLFSMFTGPPQYELITTENAGLDNRTCDQLFWINFNVTNRNTSIHFPVFLDQTPGKNHSMCYRQDNGNRPLGSTTNCNQIAGNGEGAPVNTANRSNGTYWVQGMAWLCGQRAYFILPPGWTGVCAPIFISDHTFKITVGNTTMPRRQRRDVSAVQPHDPIWGSDVPQDFKLWITGQKVVHALFPWVGVGKHALRIETLDYRFGLFLNASYGWARGWTGKGQRAPVRLRRQQGGGGVLVWAGIIKDELVGPFRVEDGVKLNSQSYCQFLEDTFFKQWYRKKSASFKKNMIFMQDNAPSHASKYSTAWLARKGIKKEKLMTWPPCSPDLNPIENLWSIIKCEIYKEGKRYTSLNSVWEAVVAAARNVDGEQIKTLTESMDGRLLSVLAKKGGYIGR
ncbi:unnamed protein product [Oreochromis niloticus]|nr:unnamed protein product [Mustela putorius furo]